MEQPPVKSRTVRFWSVIVLAILGLVALIFVAGSIPGNPALALLPIVFLGSALYQFVLFLKTPHDEPLPEDPRGLPIEDQVAYYKRVLILGLIGFPAVSWFVVSDLDELVSGSTQSVEVFAPAAWLYEWLGYWGGVLATPVLGVGCLAVLAWKIVTLKRRQNDQRQPDS